MNIKYGRQQAMNYNVYRNMFIDSRFVYCLSVLKGAGR